MILFAAGFVTGAVTSPVVIWILLLALYIRLARFDRRRR